MHQELVRIGCSLIILVELVAYFAVPRWLARIAMVPLGLARRLRIRDDLWTVAGGEADYRSAPPRRIDWARVPLPEVVQDEDIVGWRTADRRGLLLRLRWKNRKGLALVAVRLSQDGDVLRVEPRFMPTPFLCFVLAPVLLIFDPHFRHMGWLGAVFAAVAVVVNVLFCLHRTQKAVRPLVDELERSTAGS